MQLVTISKIHCGNAAEIDRQWHINGQSGNTIKFNGILAPPPLTAEGKSARAHLVLVLTGTQIEIGRMHGVSSEGHLLCDVYHRGLHLTKQVPTRYRNKTVGIRCHGCRCCSAGLNKGPPVTLSVSDSLWHVLC